MQVSLERLTQGELPFVVLMPKGTGQREDRFGHVLCGTPQMPVASDQSAGRVTNSELADEVALLRRQLDALYELTGHTKEEPDS